MSRPFIVVGDRVNHGGAVVTGSPATDINGKAVARVGDRVVCSKHGQTVIVSGDGTIIIDGNPVARHGDKTACGATLLSSQIAVFVDPGGGNGGSSQSAAGAVVAAAAATAAAVAAKYDQAIQFVNDDGQPLPNVNYTLTFADGQTHSGVTNASGVTQRVTTETEQKIVKAELSADGAEAAPCCAKIAPSNDPFVVDLESMSVATTSTEIGTSLKKVKAKGHERPLTSGEISMARSVFGDSVDYSQVKVHNHGYPLFLGLQNKDTAVTPNGEMYMPPDIYEDDYSLLKEDHALFIHEMVHVWQHQLGYTVRIHGLTVSSRGPRAYVYAIKPENELSDFNMEQQGDIISDYYMIVLINNFRNALGSKGTPEQLRMVLSKFLKNPSSRENLPK